MSDKLGSIINIEERMVAFPESVFLMGADPAAIEERLRELDVKKHLGIGNVLDGTPPVWVHLDGYNIMSRMVTNGDYAEFLAYTDEEGSFYDAPDLWRHVWADLGFHIESAQLPFRSADGSVSFFEANFSACGSFAEAYLQSILHEVECVFLALPEEHTGGGGLDDIGAMGAAPKPSLPREHMVRRVFALLRYKLRDVMGDEGGADILTAEERGLLAELPDNNTAASDVEHIIMELRRGYGRNVDPRLQQAFKKGQVVIESILLLERFLVALRDEPDLQATIPFSKIIYPRQWKSPSGVVRRRRLMGTAVPWEQCPVVGISFYEALAYAAWLSSITGKNISLPNEAQYERASSWPRDNLQPGKPIKLDASNKLLFPWQDHNPQDFKYYFGREGREVEGYYQKARDLYKDLLDATCRKLASGGVMFQMEGFGWHWTCDRYSDNERKYSRFSDSDYPRYNGAPCVDGSGNRADVAHYQRNRNPSDSLIVLKGSPDVLGGPGITTRRYAAYPLRGYFNTGFRLVSED